MTVTTKFHSWQSEPMRPDPGRCSPNLLVLRDHLIATWGGQHLGCYSARSIRGGSSPSSHASGAALDWRWQDPGPGRAVLDAEVLPFLINNSAELGIQAIHDYQASRIWRPPAYRDALNQAHANGWRWSAGSGMGETWACWIHVEVHPDAWLDSRPIDEKLRAAVTPAPPPAPTPVPVPPPPTVKGTIVMNLALTGFPVLNPGDSGQWVTIWQELVNRVHNAKLLVDGQFGQRSQDVARYIRVTNGLTNEPRVDVATWAISFPK